MLQLCEQGGPAVADEGCCVPMLREGICQADELLCTLREQLAVGCGGGHL